MSKHTPKQADGTCKTCKYFGKSYYSDFVGHCSITLPPWLVNQHYDTEVHKDASCDLYVAEATGEQE